MATHFTVQRFAGSHRNVSPTQTPFLHWVRFGSGSGSGSCAIHAWWHYLCLLNIRLINCTSESYYNTNQTTEAARNNKNVKYYKRKTFGCHTALCTQTRIWYGTRLENENTLLSIPMTLFIIRIVSPLNKRIGNIIYLLGFDSSPTSAIPRIPRHNTKVKNCYIHHECKSLSLWKKY